MLRPNQFRHLMFLAFLGVLAAILLYIYKESGSFRIVGQAPVRTSSPDIVDAPPPPPSPYAGRRLLDGALEDVRDLSGFREVDKEPAYRKLAEYVATVVNDKGLRENSEGPLLYGTFIKHAPELRGRIFTIRGIAQGAPQVYRLETPIAGREDIYGVYVVDNPNSSAGGGIIFDLVDRPEEPIEKLDEVEITGIFYKVVSTTMDLKRGKTREMPLLVARSLRKVPPPPDEASGPLAWLGFRGRLFDYVKIIVVVGIMATLIIAYVIHQRMSRIPRTSAYKSLRRHRMGPKGKRLSPSTDRPPSGLKPEPPAPPGES